MVNQDFHTPANPWIHTSLGYLIDYFEVLEPRANGSVLLRLLRAVEPTALREAGRYEDLPMKSRLERVDRLIDAFSDGAFGQRYLLIVKARIMAQGGDLVGAGRFLNKVEQKMKWLDSFLPRRVEGVRKIIAELS